MADPTTWPALYLAGALPGRRSTWPALP